MGAVYKMVPTLLLLVISTALAAPRGNMTGPQDSMEGSEGPQDYMEGSEEPQDYMEGSEDNSDNSSDYSGELQDYSGNYLDNSDNYTDYLDGVILERSDSLLEDRAINTCGCAPVSSSNRIVGGKEVNPKGKLPYQVFFRGCMPDGRCGMCGGTIVNKKFVITAAHCYDSRMTSFTVIVGEHNLCDGLTNEGGKAIKVKKMTLHPDYNKDTISNDIAVLELAEDLTFTKKVKPACLPSSETKDYSGSASTVSGWGGTIGYGPNDQRPQQPRQCTLKETIVKLLKGSDPMCSKVLGTTSSKIKLCAFKKDTDACQGDSGGPLTVPENGKYTLVGVVSYGSGCASSTPGIYARVQGYLPWIKNLISSGECSGSSSGSSGGATTGKPSTAKPTTTASSNGYGNDYYSYYG